MTGHIIVLDLYGVHANYFAILNELLSLRFFYFLELNWVHYREKGVSGVGNEDTFDRDQALLEGLVQCLRGPLVASIVMRP